MAAAGGGAIEPALAAGKSDPAAAFDAAHKQCVSEHKQAMIIIWIIFVSSVVVLPATALLALRWTARHGGFDDLQKTALSIFDEEEPVGRMTDRFPASTANEKKPRS
jgi:nitrogen fixation-related uncharacterized protein